MSKSFYSYAIFLAIMGFLNTLAQGVVYFMVGRRILELSSLKAWLIVSFFIALVNALILLKYYRFKNYRFAYWMIVITIGTSFFSMVSQYKFVDTREVTMAYLTSSLVVVLTAIMYSMALVFSAVRKRPWLRVSGILSLVTGLIWVSTAVWVLLSQDARFSGTGERVDQWTSLISSLFPLLFAINFQRERSEASDSASSNSTFESLMTAGSFAAFICLFYFGQAFVLEGIEKFRNPGMVWEGTKALAEQFEPGEYVNNKGESLPYRLLIPLGYDSTKKYPLVVCLHGSSGCGSDNVRQVGSCIPASFLSNAENRSKYPAFLFVPQCPLNKTWGMTQETPSVDSLVIETIATLKMKYPIDERRCYVSGNSLGGYGAWYMISRYPEMFAAAIPISGGGDPSFAEKMVDIPIWAFHGKKDLNVPVSGSQDVVEAIEKAGGNPKYTEYPDKAHDIWNEVTTTPGLLDWLFAQSKK